jgi:hypothetical protein
MNNCLLFFQNDTKNAKRKMVHIPNQKIKKSNLNITEDLFFYQINKRKWNILTKYISDSKKVVFFKNSLFPGIDFGEILYGDLKNYTNKPLFVDIQSTVPFSSQESEKKEELKNFIDIEKFSGKQKSVYRKRNRLSFLFTTSILFCKTSQKVAYEYMSDLHSHFLCAVVPNCKTLLSEMFLKKLKMYSINFHYRKSFEDSVKSSELSENQKNNESVSISKIDDHQSDKGDLFFFLFFIKNKTMSALVPAEPYRKIT